jgi:hypothetical protein
MVLRARGKRQEKREAREATKARGDLSCAVVVFDDLSIRLPHIHDSYSKVLIN